MKLLLPFLLLTLRLSSGKNFIYRTAFFWNLSWSCVDWSFYLSNFVFFFNWWVFKRTQSISYLQCCVLFLIVLCKYLSWLYICSSMLRKAGPKVMCAADLCPAGTKPGLGLYLIFVLVPWPNRLSQPTKRLPALGGQRAGSHLLELGSGVAAVRPEPGGLCPALCTVSGLQVSKLWLLSLPAISRKTAKGCTCGIATVTATAQLERKYFHSVLSVRWLAVPRSITPKTTSQGEVILLGSLMHYYLLEPVLRPWRLTQSQKQKWNLWVKSDASTPANELLQGIYEPVFAWKTVRLFNHESDRRKTWSSDKSATGLWCCFFFINYDGA